MEDLPNFQDNQFDLAIIDPPYGIKADKGFSGAGGFSGKGKPIERRRYNDEWDTKPTQDYFNHLLRVAKNVLIFGGNYFTDMLPQSNHWIVWNKLNTMPSFGDCELIWTNINRNSVKIIEHEWNGLIGKEENRFHPTQKPVILYQKLLKLYAKPSYKILDTHLGSGSISIACWEAHLDLIGYETNIEFYNLALKRLEEHKRQFNIFLPTEINLFI